MQDYSVDYSDDMFTEEMIDGKIYVMARPCDEHLLVQGNLYEIFMNYFRKNKRKCRAIFEGELYIDEKNYVEPDLMIYCKNNNEKKNQTIPVIIIEVLSPSTWKKDVTAKMKKYAEIGIEEYWTVDYEAQRIVVYKLNDTQYDLYESYYYSTKNYFSRIPKIRKYEESEIVKEFSPVSFPELTISLEDVFNFEALEYIR